MEEIFEPECQYNDVLTSSTKTFLCKNSSFQPGQDLFSIEIPPQELWLDFSSAVLCMKFSIVKKNGEKLKEEECNDFSIINAIGKTFVKTLEVSCQNDKIIRHAQLDYRSYINLTLTETKNSLGWAQSSLTFMDAHGGFNNFTEKENRGWEYRRGYVKASKPVRTIAKLDCFPFNIGQPMPPGISFNFDFYRNTDEFCLLGAAALDPIIKVDEFELRVDVIKPVTLASELAFKNFSLGKVAKYPFNQVVLENHSIPKDKSLYRIEFNRNRAMRPNVIIYGFVEETAFLGSKTENPFSFKHHDIENIQIKCGEKLVYQPDLKLDFGSGDYLNAYWGLIKELGYTESDTNLFFTRNSYDNEYVFFAANIQNCVDSEAKSISNEAGDANQIDIILRFKNVLTKNLRLIIYGIYDNLCTVSLVDEEGRKNQRKIVKLNQVF